MFAIHRSELRAAVASVPNGPAILGLLTTVPREVWRAVPPGFNDKDRQPWRFRRRLSLLRRPIVQLDQSEDPLLIIAPGLARDALVTSFDFLYQVL